MSIIGPNIFRFFNKNIVIKKVISKNKKNGSNKLDFAKYSSTAKVNKEDISECLALYYKYHSSVREFIKKLSKLKNIKKKLSKLKKKFSNKKLTKEKKDFIKKLKEDRDELEQILDFDIQVVGRLSKKLTYCKYKPYKNNIIVKGGINKHTNRYECYY